MSICIELNKVESGDDGVDIGLTFPLKNDDDAKNLFDEHCRLMSSCRLWDDVLA